MKPKVKPKIKRVREINKILTDLGIIPRSVVKTKKHIKIRLPNGHVVFASSTPSDRRELNNLKSKLKKANSL